MERIIVGVDGSACSEEALRWAAAQARRRDASLTAVLVWDVLDRHHPDAVAHVDAEHREAAARQALDTAVDRALGADGAAVDREVVGDRPAAGLLDAARGADLLVVGARGLGAFRGMLLGSVSQRCIDHGRCPVAVIRGVDGDGASHGRIAVGVDGSEPAEAALRWAVDEARRRDAVLEVVHAWHMPYVGAYPYVGDAFELELVERAAGELVDRALSTTVGPPVTVERTVVHGTPARSLIDAAEDADLIVVGARGLGGFSGLLLGSVSHQVARHADRPVVVVPAEW